MTTAQGDGPRVSALLVIERSARAVADAIAGGLGASGVVTTVNDLDRAALTPADAAEADLVVLGVRASACRATDGEAVRSWLARARAGASGQLAAAFELRRGPMLGPDRGAAYGACRLFSAHGFRLAQLPAHFRVQDPADAPSRDELLKAHAWGSSLGRVAHTMLGSTCSLSPALTPALVAPARRR